MCEEEEESSKESNILGLSSISFSHSLLKDALSDVIYNLANDDTNNRAAARKREEQYFGYFLSSLEDVYLSRGCQTKESVWLVFGHTQNGLDFRGFEEILTPGFWLSLSSSSLFAHANCHTFTSQLHALRMPNL